jgi:VWFA-related protein
MKRNFVRPAKMFLVLMISCPMLPQKADRAESASATLKVDSSFVWVPTLIRSARGNQVHDIAADQFQLWDNGVPQKVGPVDTDGLPISLVILMQTGGAAGSYLPIYADLPSALGWLAGGSVHETTLVTFDSHVREIWHFPKRSDGIEYAFARQRRGDAGAAIKDAVYFGVQQLRGEPGRFRRIVLLLSDGNDDASAVSSQALIKELGMASTVVYSLVVPGGKKRVVRVVRRERTAAPECPASALEREIMALDTNAAAEVTSLTGGDSVEFDDRQTFSSALDEIAADIRDAYTLGFQPSRSSPGLHTIRVAINSPKLKATARSAYWYQPNTSTGDSHQPE